MTLPSVYSAPEWSPGLMSTATDETGQTVRMEIVKVQGVKAHITPTWALEVPGVTEGTFHIALKRSAPLVVVDFPAGHDLSEFPHWAAQGWHLQARHTRWFSLAENFAEALPRNRRKQIRRADRAGMTPLPLNDMSVLAGTHTASRTRKSIASDTEKLHSLLNKLHNAGKLSARGIRTANGWLATAGFVQAGDRWVYAFGGATEHTKDSALAVVRLLAEAMQEAQDAGMRHFDFGGSADPGVDNFYAEFGAAKVPRVRAVWAAAWVRPWLRWRRPDLFR